MPSLVHPQLFNVGPVQNPALLRRHLLGVEQCSRFDVRGFRRRLQPVDEGAQANAEPGHHH